METMEALDKFLGITETSFNPKQAVAWVEKKPPTTQALYAKDIFQELFQSAARPKQSSGNACVKLCGFIELCARSASTPLSKFAFAEETAWDLFNFFIEWNEQDQHRSMRLVLDFLKLFISNNPDPEVGKVIKTRVLNDTISMIALQSTRPSVKSAMTALDHFLQKKLLNLPDVLDIYRHVHRIPSSQDVTWDEFITKIFNWMDMQYVCPQAGKLLVTIFTSPWSEDEETRFFPDSWHKFLRKALFTNTELLEPIKLYVLVPLFKSDRTQSLAYVNYLFTLQTLTSKDNNDIDVNSVLWLATLEAGKKVGVVDEPDIEPGILPGLHGVTRVQAGVLEDILGHSSHEARSSAVSILIASPSTTKPYAAVALKLLRKHLPAFHADTDAKFRYDVLGHSRNMIKRIHGAIVSLSREHERNFKKAQKSTNKPGLAGNDQSKSPKTATSTDPHAALLQHEAFVHWYLEFLKQELVPTASYQRHITALKATTLVLNAGLVSGAHDECSTTEAAFSLTDATWVRSVMDLIMDPFDDVREAAASLLMKLPSAIVVDELEEFCTRANALASKTARADHSDGVARSQELRCSLATAQKDKLIIPEKLIVELEAKLSAAEKDLALAVLEAPVHGNFASLRYIWEALSGGKYSQQELETLNSLQIRAMTCCIRIWQMVRHVLCDDSPEGHLPEELEEVDGLDTKDVLSYSFRAIHESSNLLRAIISNARYHGIPGFLSPTPGDFEAIGRLTFDELSHLRHRGAFTTVSQTFTSCCQLVKFYPTPSGDQNFLLDQWYKGTLDCIYAQVSTTRRSAGIPALMVGVLSANAEHPSVQTAIQELRGIAQKPARTLDTDGSNLPQVHALNCLNNISKSSYLSKRAEIYLTECFKLSTDSLKSEVWAIRNCGLLLLRSLIDCLFGTSESKISMEAGWDGRTTKISWHKFEALPAVLVSLLEMGQQPSTSAKGSETAEAVFPALDIIRRAGPPGQLKDQLYDSIAWYLGSHLWHVREIAARTLCSFLLRPGWIDPIRALLEESRSSANRLHGALLTFKFLLERLLDVMPDQLTCYYPNVLVSVLEEVSTQGGSFHTCSEARAVYCEIVSFVNNLRVFAAASSTDPSVEHALLQPISMSTGMLDSSNQEHFSSALLSSKQGQAIAGYSVLELFNHGKTPESFDLGSALSSDINVACDMLETLAKASAGSLPSHISVSQHLIRICLKTCQQTDAPEPQIIALEMLAQHLDLVLGKQPAELILPTKEEICLLWADLRSKSMNPGLSDAIIQASGPLLAVVMIQTKQPSDSDNKSWLRSWGTMMGDAGLADKAFDTRMAAIESIRSFSSHVSLSSQTSTSTAHLPWLLALYDALNDDDDEIRDVAAAATAPLLGKSLVSMEAGVRLLAWLGQRFGHTNEFRAHVACRMIGHSSSSGSAGVNVINEWSSAENQLFKAMVFDDALFVVEEQNLYIDEVREAQRWRDIFAALPTHQESDAVLESLKSWTVDGLKATTKMAETDDGPLGWTSKPEVFAICARIVISGAALAERGDTEVSEALRAFWIKGTEFRVHGQVLGMCGLE
ncbi:putative death-receptor fusion protein-domain-containing protein [Pseudomassariella vexata]|uniref:Putative death-receptor fusion protein-domain-containing protein n=1 Tax=Pseudomassariella vexata TaxID=1141098 RepID=A0A1Y2DWQ1_9PEZI|nr:putative death-receptor fusion protein-domain-containing protein [Pseudomassariella vexata]ORY63566.1 putative death-receptor fusion protein-domain-containing protein [Pseudomassariella vexata]